VAMGQTMAMLEYLEETYPEVRLLPSEKALRSRVRAFCNMIACDIHPILNLRVLKYIKTEFDADPAAHWYGHWIHEGFMALEQFAGDGPFVFGDKVSLADALLVPQMYNARRFEVPLESYAKLVAAVDHCNGLEAFKNAAPEAQLDATLGPPA
jgi:maleylacetoacetate isomerase